MPIQQRDYVATAPTVHGIETCHKIVLALRYTLLQQRLPFTVLKQCSNC